MIFFVTDRHHPGVSTKYANIKIVELGKAGLYKFLKNAPVIVFDTENTGLNPIYATSLIATFGDKYNQWVVDTISYPLSTFEGKINPDTTLVGHNLKYDHNISLRNGLNLGHLKFFDTMIAEQRLGLGTGRRNSLEEVFQRRLKRHMPEDKKIRDEFIHMSNTSTYATRHIRYAAGDISGLEEIRDIQVELIEQTGLNNLLYNIEFPLIPVLGVSEMNGLVGDTEKITALMNKNISLAHQEASKMDDILRELSKKYPRLRGGKFTKHKRMKQVGEQSDLFGESLRIETKNKGNLNYNSSEQIFKIFDACALPYPIFKEKNKEPKRSMREEAVELYLVEHPNSELKPFLRTYLKYKEYNTMISRHGEKLLKSRVKDGSGKWQPGFLNSITGKIHTIYRQCETDTGRISSGDKRNAFPNMQNVRRTKEYRECFKWEPGYLISTYDLSGAELVIMSALADDEHLYNIGISDLHSPIATKCWRAVFERRMWNVQERGMMLKAQGAPESTLKPIRDEFYRLEDLSCNFLIDKNTNKQWRQDFKNFTFGAIYNMHNKKGADTINKGEAGEKITAHEAQVMIDVIKDEFPKTFAMTQAASDEAFMNGYMVINKKNNSRKYFVPVQIALEQFQGVNLTIPQLIKKVKYSMAFTDVNSVDNKARNGKIQSTQAEMIKEAMVEIDKHIRLTYAEAYLINNIHDELVYAHKDPNFGPIVGKIMSDVANTYLSLYSDTIRMGAEGVTLNSWTK